MCTMREIVDGEFSSKKARHWNAYFYNNAKALRHDIAEMLNEFWRMKGVTLSRGSPLQRRTWPAAR
jgi:hypothetical protein